MFPFSEMWLREELDSCWSLYKGLEDIKLKTFLTQDEIDCIGEDNTAYLNLRNRLIGKAPT